MCLTDFVLIRYIDINKGTCEEKCKSTGDLVNKWGDVVGHKEIYVSRE